MEIARHSAVIATHDASALRELFDTATQAVLGVDADGRFLLANRVAERIFGYSRSELIGQPLALLLPNRSVGFDLYGRRKDGSRFGVEVCLSDIGTSEGRMGVLFVSDVARLKQRDEALHQRELRFRGLFEHMSEGFAFCQMIFENGVASDFVYLAVNAQFENLTGLKNVIGKRVTEVIPKVQGLNRDLLEAYGRVAQTGFPEKFEIFIHELGQWYSISAYSPKKGFFGALFDNITQRKGTEEALRQTEGRLRLALESTGLGTFDFDMETEQLHWSNVSKSYFGLLPDAAVNPRTFDRGVHPEDRQRVQALVQEAKRPGNGGMYSAEYRTVGIDDGRDRWIDARGQVLFGPTGRPERFVGVMLDITERKRLNIALEESHDQVRALAGSLLTVLEDDRRRVSVELHEQICQSLSALALDMGGLADSPSLPAEWQGRLKGIQARVILATEEARTLANDLHSPVLDDLGLVASLRALCREFSAREGISVDFDSDTVPRSTSREVVSCLYRVTEESLHNIAKHARAEFVSVTLYRREAAMVLSISDDGQGFEMTAIKGPGRIGLTRMAERARMAGGIFTITTRPGEGTHIGLEVPTAPL